MSFAKDDLAVSGALQRLQPEFSIPDTVKTEPVSTGIEEKVPEEKIALSGTAVNKGKATDDALNKLQEGKGLLDTAGQGLSHVKNSLTLVSESVNSVKKNGFTPESINELNDFVNSTFKNVDDYVKQLNFNGQKPLDGSMNQNDTVKFDTVEMDSSYLKETSVKSLGLLESDKINLKTEEDVDKFSEKIDKALKEVKVKQKNLALTEIKLEKAAEEAASSSTVDDLSKDKTKVDDLHKNITSEIKKAPEKALEVQLYNMDENLLLAMYSMRTHV